MGSEAIDINKITDVGKILNHGYSQPWCRLSQEGDEYSPICVEFVGDKTTLMTLVPVRV
jgi:hypothetical protein